MSDRYYPSDMTKKPPAPSDIADKFMLRMPEGMRGRIAAEAEKNNRSMNAEIISRLEATLHFEDNSPEGIKDEFRRMADAAEKQLETMREIQSYLPLLEQLREKERAKEQEK
jgi:Arc-like DNA binding domain